ncbi:MAG: SDR family NAD(P)-dependent oxidoreductase [Thermodesulfobacteriota bacterium]|nr:SDR family NAD(P)-dependent oxidoreductase [Thermodesulfobacteriota bacterium]
MKNIKTIPNIPVAIIGIGCFFPKSPGVKEYWRLISRGEDGITDLPDTHWSAEEYFDTDPKKADHTYCKRGGFLSPVSFDPAEFGIPPNSIEATDTSQLLSLMAAKMAMDDAGYGKEKAFDRDKTSVILGVTGTQELVIPLSSRLGFPKWRKALQQAGVPRQTTETVIDKISDSYISWQENSFPGLLGNVVAGRICNRLGLGGTNCVVDAACASSMSAIHLGLMELISGKSDMVITGGVDTLNDIFMYMCFSKTHILSPTGDARPFSKDADGTVLGEGVGLVVLKRLEEAKKDGDKIYAVIKAMGTSSDGRSQSIYAPKPEGQAKSLRMAYENSDIDPATVRLIEAHGTGTIVGDMVEFKALNQVFSESCDSSHKCALGSVKSMIGHTKAAAGAAGLIKSALSLYNKVLPPTLKAQDPDPGLNIDQSPFYLNTDTRPWVADKKHPRRSGVSSFGFGGSNFHVVLEEYEPAKNQTSWDGSVEIFALSASSRKKLKKRFQDFKALIDSDRPFKDIAIKAAETRQTFSPEDPHRLLIVLEDFKDLPALFSKAMNALEANREKSNWNENNIYYGSGKPPGKISFVFPSQGSQYVGMGHDLACIFPEALDSLEKANKNHKGKSRLSDFIYPVPAVSKEEKTAQEENLKRTEIAQPAIGAISLSMLKILGRFGLQPDVTCGHSFGELAALCAAGWIDEDTLYFLAHCRGQLMAEAGRKNNHDSGSMLAVKAPLDQLDELISTANLDVILANRNSPDQGVLSGSTRAILQADEILSKKGFKTVKLPVSAAFHSSFVKDAQTPFAGYLKDINITPSDIPVFSNTTGLPYPLDPEKVKKILAGHLLQPVDFKSEIENIFKSGVKTFIEVGPKSVMSGLVRSILAGQSFISIPMDRSSGSRFGVSDLAATLCQLACLGYPVKLSNWEHPVLKPAQQKMSIPISGANYVKPKPETKNIKPQNSKAEYTSIRPPSERKNDPVNNNSELPPQQTKNRVSQVDYIDGKRPIMENSKQNHSNFIIDSLSLVQQGLKSMQDLQRQTAETHQKFLETQSDASRSLQQMMESTHRLVEVSLGMKSPSAEKVAKPDTERHKERQPKSTVEQTKADAARGSAGFVGSGTIETVVPDAINAVNRIEAQPEEVSVESAVKSSVLSPGLKQKDIEQTLLSVVSQLTGYPVETLGLDMDIEADLGIDSIKRVEILSTLEEKIPHLSPISPDMVGTLKTLGQIVAYMVNSQSVDESINSKGPNKKNLSFSSEENDFEPPPDQKKNIEQTLLSVVSQLTGYPVETLGLDMDIEADLGIDSIKRVEILSTLEEKMPVLPSISPDVVGTLKTLGQIVQYLENEGLKTEPFSNSTPGSLNPTDLETKPADDKPAAISNNASPLLSGTINRKVVSVMENKFHQGERISVPKGRKIFITDDKTGLSQAIIDEFELQDINTVLISPDILKYKKKLPEAAGLIMVANPEAGPEAQNTNPDLKDAFLLANHVAPDILHSSENGGAIFATITRIDGAFGFKGRGMLNPLQGGLIGLAKTAAIEWENVCCRAIDVEPGWKENLELAKLIVTELLTPDPSGPVEIGFSKNLPPGMRHTLELESSPYTLDVPHTADFTPDDVMVITGGARGITSAAALALANHGNPTLILLGRSPSPSPEPEWLATLEDESLIKKAILKNEFSQKKTSPKKIEAAYKKHMANREIANNLERLKSAGSDVTYYSVDVRKYDSVISIFHKIHSTHGPITGIIHGAGVVEDRFITDKTIKQFDKVFDTKVMGLRALLDATKEDALKYIVLFSSITARMGNRGQVDYAMANEVLNKTAWQQSVLRPDCKVISINWGPWDGGMVSPSLKREFAKNGVHLIPVQEGAKCMLYEMMGDKNAPAEVVIGSKIIVHNETDDKISLASKKKPEAVLKNNDPLSLTFKRELDVEKYPVLNSHVLDGKPVVPFALMTEWLGHGALHENPGLILHGFDDMRILNGIKLDQEKKLIRLMAGKPRKNGKTYEVNVELRNGFKDNMPVIHSRAKAILSDEPSLPPAFNSSEYFDSKTYPRSIDEVYDKILFHGSELRGIKKIIGYSPEGIIAEISSAPSPEKWMVDPLRNSWIADPLVLDSAFQMAIIWCYDEMGKVSLPSYLASYRQYCDRFPAKGITAILKVHKATDHIMRGDFTFLDPDNVIIAKLTGYEAVFDASLYKAFKPQPTSNL